MTHRLSVAALVGLVLLAPLTACGGAGASTARTAHSATLTSGSWNGRTWSLSLREGTRDHEWCWVVTGATHPSGGACGFNDPRDPTTGPSDSQPLDDGHALEYGPAPVGTTRVVLQSVELPAQASAVEADGMTSAAQPEVPIAGPPVTVLAHPLPAWAPAGLWWTAVVTHGLWEPRFYDATGHELAPPKF